MSNRFGLPISLDVAGRRCLILGGGFEATDKAKRLVKAGAVVQVIADEVEEPVAAMAEAGELGWAARGWTPGDLKNVYLVYVTPEERERADEAHQLAMANGAQICSIDVPDLCTFANPAVVEVGELRLALSSGGRAPSLLKRLREDLERGLSTEAMRAFVGELAAMREALPKGERHKMREAVEGFKVTVQVEYPAWFKAKQAEEESPTTERDPGFPGTVADHLRRGPMKLCRRCLELFAQDASFCPMDGAPLEEVSDPLVGKTISNRYRVVARLGGGGMSSVYLARHVMIDRLSAVKVLRGDLCARPEQRERFLREAQAVNRINHENIVEVTDFGEWDELVYLVMEYIPGEPLHQLLRGGPLPWQRAAVLGVQLAAALGRAHQQGVVHRDLKPANVLVVRRAGGEVAMLSDFGIAKILDAPSLTLTSQIFGTPGYIAPEYLEGSGADARIDLYSLGVVLYETLTGSLPYDEDGTMPLLMQALYRPPKPLGARGVRVPEPLSDLVMQLLARRPEQRPRGAFAVREALADVLQKAGIFTAGTIHLGAGPSVERRGEAEEASSRPFSHLAPLCASGLARVEAAAGAHALPAHARQALLQARDLSGRVAGASHAVAVEQARIAELERYGRTLRATLGRALDELSQDLASLEARREEVSRRRQAARAGDERGWEHATLVEEEVRLQAISDDQAAQVQALRAHLAVQNHALDRKLSEARLSLEGRVAALRSLAAQTWASIDEVGALVGVRVHPPETLVARAVSR